MVRNIIKPPQMKLVCVFVSIELCEINSYSMYCKAVFVTAPHFFFPLTKLYC